MEINLVWFLGKSIIECGATGFLLKVTTGSIVTSTRMRCARDMRMKSTPSLLTGDLMLDLIIGELRLWKGN